MSDRDECLDHFRTRLRGRNPPLLFTGTQNAVVTTIRARRSADDNSSFDFRAGRRGDCSSFGTDSCRTHRSHRFSRGKDMAPAKPSAGKKRKYYTVEEANKALPLVRMIVSDIVRQDRIVDDLQQRLSTLTKERRRPLNDVYAEEIAQFQAELDAEDGKLRAYVEELRKLGVELKGSDGLCDFYCVMDGREVFLDRKSTRLNSSHRCISYAVFCL